MSERDRLVCRRTAGMPALECTVKARNGARALVHVAELGGGSGGATGAGRALQSLARGVRYQVWSTAGVRVIGELERTFGGRMRVRRRWGMRGVDVLDMLDMLDVRGWTAAMELYRDLAGKTAPEWQPIWGTAAEPWAMAARS